MNLPALRYFIEVTRQKHFSKAAKVCHVSQPSLSQQIKKLEGIVGAELFVRARGNIELTPFGKEFFPYAQHIVLAEKKARNFLLDKQKKAEKVLRIGAIPTIAPYLLPKVIALLDQEISGLLFELVEYRTDELVKQLKERRIDFALLSSPTGIESMSHSVRLRDDELLLALPCHHRLCRKKTIQASDLEEETVILLENSHCLSGQSEEYCAFEGITPSVSMRGSQIETLLKLVGMGLGLTFIPRLAIADVPQESLIFRSMANPCFREIHLVWMRDEVLSWTHQQAIKMIGAHFSS